MNGKMLHSTPMFSNFEIIFLSELTFILQSETFSIDDHIFEEGDPGSNVYFITRGNIILLHKKTKTYIKELELDDYFGDYAFFTGQKRKASARAKNFSEVLKLDKKDFLDSIINFPISA